MQQVEIFRAICGSSQRQPAAPRHAIGSAAEAAATLLERADGAQKIDLAEGRPQDVGKVEFTMGALP